MAVNRAGYRAVVLALCIACALTSCSLQTTPATGAVGANVPHVPAPAFSGTLVTGASFSSSSFRGHVVVLDFWGSWCGPCQAEQPHITALAQEFLPKGVRFLGVDERDNNAAALAFIQANHVPYTSINDSSATVAGLYGVDAPPYIIVINSRNVIVGRYLGTTAGVANQLRSMGF